MSLAELLESRGWKVFAAKLNSIGSAVVIVGALFKIQHYPGASVMLMVGLLTEATIFFVGAFDPLPKEMDWTLVYPELLAGLYEQDIVHEDQKERRRQAIAKLEARQASDPVASAWDGAQGSATAIEQNKKKPTTDGSAIQKFDEMLEKAGGNNFFENLGQNFANFNEKVKDMADVADSVAASKEFSDNLTAAASSVSGFKSSADQMSYSMDNAQANIAKATEIDFSTLASGNAEYSKNIGTINKNIGAINQIFELQLKEVDFDSMINGLKDSVEYAHQYSQEVSKLSKNLSALNTVYGNMLTALNVKV